MAVFEIPGLIIAFILFSAIVFIAGQRNIPAQFQSVIGVSIFTRLVGVLAYTFVVFAIYRGGADPVIYFRWGQRFAEYFRQLDFSPFFDPTLWRGPAFTGTNFVGYPSALMLILVGESFRGTWLLFSSLCAVSIFYFAKVFFRAYGGTDYRTYLFTLTIYPSLWFWTASISKDTWMFFGVALFLTGVVNSKRRQSLFTMALGLLWCYLVRPQVAAMLAFSLAGAYFIGSFKKLNFQNIVVLVVAVVGALYFLSVVGVSDVTEVTNFAEEQRRKSSYGGSEITVAAGPLGFIQAPINVLLRPFPWEVTGFLQVISFFDIYFIWFLIVLNRKAVLRSLMSIRRDRLMAFSVIFIGLFAVGAGLALVNIGLIARQRIILYPFFFMIIYGYSDKRLAFLTKQRKKRYQEKIKALGELQKA